jgi:hypothetical protein
MDTPVMDTSDADTHDNIRLQRSKELYGCYVEHIHTLCSVVDDLTSDLYTYKTYDIDKLKNIIVGFENIIGMLLNDE